MKLKNKKRKETGEIEYEVEMPDIYEKIENFTIKEIAETKAELQDKITKAEISITEVQDYIKLLNAKIVKLDEVSTLINK